MPVKFVQQAKPKVDMNAVIAAFVQQQEINAQEVAAAIAHLTEPGPYLREVVGPREFCISPYYMNARREDGTLELFPVTVDTVEEICENGYEEVVLTGGIGSFKTTIALYSLAYQLYLLSCLRDPHAQFGLDSASEIVFIFQSLKLTTAQTVDYERFRAMIDRSPYFQRFFPFDKTRKSDMRFLHRIVVTPTATTISGAIGQNVVGGLIDEINFMQTIEKSRRAVDNAVFDQAKVLYEIIDRRRRSRFMKQGKLPGLLCMSSSKHYPGEFTDKKVEEAEREIQRYGRTTIYIYHKRVWEVKPQDYSGVTFRMFIGDEGRKPRILDDDDVIKKEDAHLVDHVPVELKGKYEEDPYGALRDFSGAATASRYPFIMNLDKLGACFDTRVSILNADETDFDKIKLEFYPDLFKKHTKKRWVHVDLGLTSDSAGVACGYVDHFKPIERGGYTELMPVVEVDFILRVRPPKNGEILFYKVRELLYLLKKHKLNLKWISFDSYQSVDSIQLLRRHGFITGEISMDKSSVPYDFTKMAFYDERLHLPRHDHCQVEFSQLERDPKKGNIDHRPLGSKDCSDAVAGVVYGLTTRRELWVEAGIPVRLVPDSIMQAIQREQERQRGHTQGEHRGKQQRQASQQVAKEFADA